MSYPRPWELRDHYGPEILFTGILSPENPPKDPLNLAPWAILGRGSPATTSAQEFYLRGLSPPKDPLNLAPRWRPSSIVYFPYLAYNMGYLCIYQKLPTSFHDTSTSLRPSHENQMIWSQYHIISWYDIDTPYPRPSQIFPTRSFSLPWGLATWYFGFAPRRSDRAPETYLIHSSHFVTA